MTQGPTSAGRTIRCHTRWSAARFTAAALVWCLFGHQLHAACTPASAGLINWWAAESNGEDTAGTEDVTLINGTTFTPGRVGNAFSFDGTNDVGLIDAAPVPPPWTAEFWVKREAAPEDSAVLLSDTNAALKLEQYPNTKRVGITRWGVQDHSFNYIMPTGVWTHLVFVGASNSTLLYTNGALQGSLAVGISLPRTTMGRDITNRFSKALKGLLDETSLYNRALAATEIQALYLAGADGKCPPQCTTAPADLVNWWLGESAGEDVAGPNPLTTLNGLSSAPGLVGSAFSFDGTDDIGLIDAPALPPPWSAEFWVKRQASPEDSAVLLSDTNASLKLEQYPDTKKVGITRWGVQDQSFNYIAPTGVWTHLVFVGTSSNTALYANGGWQGALATSISLPRTTMGRDITNRFSKALKGLLDEPSLYARALTSNEVFALYAAGSAGKCPTLNCTNNDDFACRTVLVGTNIAFELPTIEATGEPGEPLHGGTNDSDSIWYSWTAPTRGSVVIDAYHNPSFTAPYVVAVYQGETLATLASVASNVSLAFQRAQVHFTAFENETYQIALAGDDGWGLELRLLPPPTNDSFADAARISASFLEATNVTFRGASREPGEPSHGNDFPETLWWRWTAPTNLKVSAIPARLTADAVIHVPDIAVYTGNGVDALTPVISEQLSDGMQRTITFTALPGTSYHIAVAGKQNDASAAVRLVGDIRFRFNLRALALDIHNVISITNTNGAVEFTATAAVTNRGSATSGPLRVRLSALPGISMRGNTSYPDEPVEVLGDWMTAPMAPSQFTNLPITATTPPLPLTMGGSSSAEGYGVHAELQEQATSNVWMTVDAALVVYGEWPDLNGIPGPGGGVIRLDPGFIGGSAFNPLIAVNVIGPPVAIEGQPTSYFGRAHYASGLQHDFTNTVWLASVPTITNGLFTPGVVVSNTPVDVTAQFSDSGFLYDITTNVTVIDLPPPVLRQVSMSGTEFVMQIQGVSNRTHVVQAATNLSPPVAWLPVSTNALGPAGMILFTNSTGVFPQRYFRAREED